MRKIILSACFVMIAVPLIAGDTVSSVSFNPSRLGRYTYLKVRNQANLKGGLVVDGNGFGVVEGSSSQKAVKTYEECLQGGYGASVCDKLLGKLNFKSPNTSLVSASASQKVPLKINQVEGMASEVKVNMEGTEFNVPGTGDAAGVFMRGGTLVMNQADSTVKNMFRGNTLLTVSSDQLTGDNAISVNNALTLIGVPIEKPSCSKYKWQTIRGPHGGRLDVLVYEDACNTASSGQYTWTKVDGGFYMKKTSKSSNNWESLVSAGLPKFRARLAEVCMEGVTNNSCGLLLEDYTSDKGIGNPGGVCYTSMPSNCTKEQKGLHAIHYSHTYGEGVCSLTIHGIYECQ